MSVRLEAYQRIVGLERYATFFVLFAALQKVSVNYELRDEGFDG